MRADAGIIAESGRFAIERFSKSSVPKPLSDAANSFQAALNELYAAEMELERQIVDLRSYIDAGALNSSPLNPSPNLQV